MLALVRVPRASQSYVRPAKIDIDPPPNRFKAYTVSVFGLTAIPFGCEPTACSRAGVWHPEVIVALQVAPSTSETPALEKSVM